MIVRGDCVEQMRLMPEASVDAIVCDPPYGFPGGFMAKRWDNFDGRTNVAFGYYLAGLIDGEGCFRVQRHERGSHSCTFTLTLRSDDEATLRKAQQFLGYGQLAQLRERERSRPVSRWAVQDKEGCAALVAMLRRFPLYAKKGQEFEVWANAVEEWHERPRGNRWAGPADQTAAAGYKARIERLREYRDPPWSGHRFQDWCREWGEEALRVLKPGGHILAAGAPRTTHRLAAGLEDAGFEIRDTVTHLFGSGFPKSYNLPGGLGTALKPAAEFWVLARKPLAGTVAANVLAHGTGALNVDGCRIEHDGRGIWGDHGQDVTRHQAQVGSDGHTLGRGWAGSGSHRHAAGRWPANVLLDESAAALLDQQTGELTSGAPGTMRLGENRGAAYGAESRPPGTPMTGFGDSGGASRFFYVAKASSAERNAGLDGFEVAEDEGARRVGKNRERQCNICGSRSKPSNYIGGDSRSWPSCGHDDWDWQEFLPERHKGGGRNVHPTVKPVDLMRWLVRLVTPPGGTVLDPFAGSGTTGIAAVLEGFEFVGIEREAEYADIAEARIAWWARNPPGTDTDAALEAGRERDAVAGTGQLGIFDEEAA